MARLRVIGRVGCESTCVVGRFGVWRRTTRLRVEFFVERLDSGSTVRSAWLGWCSQATEGQWGMPGHTEARKGAVSCDKPGGAAHRL